MVVEVSIVPFVEISHPFQFAEHPVDVSFIPHVVGLLIWMYLYQQGRRCGIYEQGKTPASWGRDRGQHDSHMREMCHPALVRTSVFVINVSSVCVTFMEIERETQWGDVSAFSYSPFESLGDLIRLCKLTIRSYISCRDRGLRTTRR